MSAYARKLVPFILLTLPLTLLAANPDTSVMTHEELEAAITQLHRPDILKAWTVYGDETWNGQRSCVTHRDIYIVSAPRKIDTNLVRSNVIELSFEAEQKLQSGCAKLLKIKEQHLTAAKFIGHKESYTLSPTSAAGFFKIYGKMTDKQLIELGDVVSRSRECILHKKKCEKLNLTIYLPNSLAERLNSVSRENMDFVLVQPSPSNTGPFLITFRPYPLRDLVMNVYGLGTKKLLVGISFAIP